MAHPTDHRPTHIPTNISSSAVSSTTATPIQTPRKDSSLAPSPSVSHRSSFTENVRNYPPSPRAQRNHSFSGQALTDLLMNPPVKGQAADARFKGRDWRNIRVDEIIDPAETRFVELDSSIEDTTKLLIRGGAPNVVLVRESRTTKTAIGTFGYDDLNAYLLLVLGMSQPDELAAQLATKARAGETLPLKDVKDHLGPTEEPAYLPQTANLLQAMEALGSGMHRIVVTKEGTTEAIGVLTQLRLVRFFWENHQAFSVTEKLYSLSLKDLDVGAKEVLAINGDKPLSDALRLMHDRAVTSLPVLDGNNNVVGNISHVDVRLLTDTSAIPLLSQSCIHFISVILSERGVQDGKDSYPVFHVTPFSTLAHTVAKLCATRSHRMWIVDAPSPSSSIPPSPGPAHHHASPFFNSPLPSSHGPVHHHERTGSTSRTFSGSNEALSGSAHNLSGSAVSASVNPGANMSGRLSGVVSLTDVLNLLARASGLAPGDPEDARNRRQRRRTSSSSSTRPSVDGAGSAGVSVRPSGEFLRGSAELGRSSSRGSERRR